MLILLVLGLLHMRCSTPITVHQACTAISTPQPKSTDSIMRIQSQCVRLRGATLDSRGRWELRRVLTIADWLADRLRDQRKTKRSRGAGQSQVLLS